MCECHGAEVVTHPRQFAQSVVGHTPVRQDLPELQERVAVHSVDIPARICCQERRHKHVCRVAANHAVVAVVTLSAEHCPAQEACVRVGDVVVLRLNAPLHDVAVGNEPVVNLVGKIVVLRAYAGERCTYSHLRDIERAGQVLLYVLVTVDDRVRLSHVTLAVELDLQSWQRFEGHLDIQIGRLRLRSRLHNHRVTAQPAFAFGFLYKVVTEEAERKIVARRIQVTHLSLSHESSLRSKARYGDRGVVAIGDLHAADECAHVGEHVACHLRRCALVGVFRTHLQGDRSAHGRGDRCLVVAVGAHLHLHLVPEAVSSLYLHQLRA